MVIQNCYRKQTDSGWQIALTLTGSVIKFVLFLEQLNNVFWQMLCIPYCLSNWKWFAPAYSHYRMTSDRNTKNACFVQIIQIDISPKKVLPVIKKCTAWECTIQYCSHEAMTAVYWPTRLFLRLGFWILLFSAWQGKPTHKEAHQPFPPSAIVTSICHRLSPFFHVLDAFFYAYPKICKWKHAFIFLERTEWFCHLQISIVSF